MIRIADFITKAAFEGPKRAAVSFEGLTLTWAELERRCWAIASAFRDLGVGKGERIAYLGQNSHRQFEAYLWPTRIGAILVPLNYRLSIAELIECVADCTPRVLVVDRHFVEEARAIADACTSIDVLVYADDGEVPAGMESYEALLDDAGAPDIRALDALASSGDDTMILFYTSGSEGKPKGVMLSHAGLFINVLGQAPAYGWSSDDIFLLSGPMFHLGAGSRVFAALVNAGHMVIVEKFDPVLVMQVIQTHRITSVTFVPTMLSMIMNHPDYDPHNLSTLRLICYGAAPMPIGLIERAVAELPHARFGQSYGMTETSPVLTILGPEHHDPAGEHPERLKSVGQPLVYSDLRIVDENDRPLGPGETGEIVIRGPQVMNGYWNQPERTAEALRGGYYHTGDAGYLDEDGYLYLAGRVKEMIISGGENVYPIETENALSKHPAVAECAVIGLPHEKWGEAVHAVVRLKTDGAASEQDLIDHCRALIAHYKCPLEITFRDELMPLSPTNKVLKSVLREQILARVT